MHTTQLALYAMHSAGNKNQAGSIRATQSDDRMAIRAKHQTEPGSYSRIHAQLYKSSFLKAKCSPMEKMKYASQNMPMPGMAHSCTSGAQVSDDVHNKQREISKCSLDSDYETGS